jgi:hypothetical protein
VGRGLIGLVLFGCLCWAAPVLARANAFSDWAAVIVAGDWRAHSGVPSEVFDNARRDVAKSLVSAGFSPDHIRQFSVHEAKGEAPFKSDLIVIATQLDQLTQETHGGCLVYFTSHGSPAGVVVGDYIWPPAAMAGVIDETCGARPTVVVISACFSGVFVPALAGPNRMVLTAARPDRASFGCGEEDQYTYFDGCVLQSLPDAHDFVDLGQAARACVARREHAMGATPPSEPQLQVGVTLRPILPLYAFARPAEAPLSQGPPAP